MTEARSETRPPLDWGALEWRVSFFCQGQPVTQGNKTAVARGRVREGRTAKAHRRWKAWRETVCAEARVAMRRAGVFTIVSPVAISMAFFIQRPPSHYTATGALKASAPALPSRDRDGDLEKLARCVMDALQDAWLLRTDALACDMLLSKRFAESPGVRVKVAVP